MMWFGTRPSCPFRRLYKMTKDSTQVHKIQLKACNDNEADYQTFLGLGLEISSPVTTN